MLIPSPRHTPADLRLWAELEESDLAHAGSIGLLVRRSIAEVTDYASRGPCYAGFSGGKDSLVMLGVLAEAGLINLVPVVFHRAVPKANPDALIAITEAERLFGITVHVRDYHSPVPVGMTRDEAEKIAGKNFLHACNQTTREFGRRIIGVRADESGVRKISLRRWGLSTANSCRPLGWWTLPDVYAYAACNRLPLCSVYGMLGGGRWDRHSLRVDALMGANGDQFGRAEWEIEYYGDVLRRIESAK